MGDDSANGRVTLARLGDKIDVLIEKQTETNQALEKAVIEMRSNTNRITATEIKMDHCASDIKELKDDVKAVESRDKWTSYINGFLSALFSIIAGIVGVNK